MLDLSTPDLTRMAVTRAMNNRTETRRLLNALHACRGGRRKYAGLTLSQAFAKADHQDLRWIIARLRKNLYPGVGYTQTSGVLDRLQMIAKQLRPRRHGRVYAELIRAWFLPTGELKREWNL